MPPSDPHQGGSLTDMAESGTAIPNDAGKQRIIPSVPRPDQRSDNAHFHNDALEQPDLQGAADNAADIPRSAKDMGATGDVITGTGDTLPPQVQSKNLHFSPNEPLAKGDSRYDKHRKAESDIERFAGEGAGVDRAPGEEKDDEEQVKARKEEKLV